MGSNIIEGSLGTKSYVPPQWQMPKAKVGTVVLWSWNRDSEKSVAFVMKAGTSAVELLVHVASVKDHVIKTGVRHVDDPFLYKHPEHDGGCWSHTKKHERIERLLKNFEEEVE